MSGYYRSYSDYLGAQRCCDSRGAGPVGPEGPTGPGSVGPRGYTGPTGESVTGPTGRGCRGPTGPAGGPTGETGSTGPAGNISVLGPGTGAVLLNGQDGVYYSRILTSNDTELDISGNLVPTVSNTFTLGYTGSRWKEIFIGPGSLNIAGPTASAVPATIGSNLSGIAYSQFGFAAPFLNLGPVIDPFSPLGTAGGWNIFGTGPTGEYFTDLRAQLINTGGSGFTGPSYSLIYNNGYTGDTGPTGAQGIQGSTGPQGIQGVTGAQGIQGAASSVTGPTGPLGLATIQGYYGNFFSNQSQSYTGATGSGQPITINNTIAAYGVSIENSSQLTFANTGIYDIQFSTQIKNPSGGGVGDRLVSIWFRENGVDISNSNTVVHVPSNTYAVAAWDYQVNITSPAQYVELIWSTNDTNTILEAGGPSFGGPAIPSVIVTVMPVANILQGPTGPTGAKTFVIDHPIDTSKYLVHACLEGPESGVYYRGEGVITDNHFTTIELPHYVEKLAKNFTVNVTPIYDELYESDINLKCSRVLNNKFNVYGKNCSFFWFVYGERLSIEVEPYRINLNVKGDGPYTWVQYE